MPDVLEKKRKLLIILLANAKNVWYKRKPDGEIENKEYKILWDMKIQYDQVIEAKRIDLVFINNKEKEVRMIDVAVPVDLRVNDKEFEKIEKDQLLKDETLRL